MAHEYEYAVIVDYLSPETISGIPPNFTKQKTQVAFGNGFQRLAGKLPSAIDATLGDGWQINSHSITFQDRVPIISILLQKIRT